MKTPHVDPVGLVEYPEDHQGTPRRFSLRQRLFAGALLLFFFAVTVVTGAVTLGEYCLTSDGGDTRVLHESLEQWLAAPSERSPAPLDEAP